MTGIYVSRVSLSWLMAIVLVTSCLAVPAQAASESDREAKQAKLDEACEQAREQKLAPLRAQFVEECVREKHQSSREACEAFYADYGARSGNRAPLFYDLPECVEAFDYQNSQRRPR